MPLTDRVDWFRMVAASCRREERLFLDQGVASRERLRKALSVRACKEYCSLERSFLPIKIYTCTWIYAAVAHQSKGIFYVFESPFTLLP